MCDISLLDRAADFALGTGHDLGATVVYVRDDDGGCQVFPRGACSDRSWLDPVRNALGFSATNRDWLDFKRAQDDGDEVHLFTVGLDYEAKAMPVVLPLEVFA
jgi:hypothetical protein